jgi:hypothetical protein
MHSVQRPPSPLACRRVHYRTPELATDADNEGVSVEPNPSRLRIEKARSHATVTLSNGQTVLGCFFVAGASLRTAGRERVADLLNDETGFFPFEIHDTGPVRTALYNRSQVVMVMLAESEARRDPGYSLATERRISVLLSNGQRLTGGIRVYRPEGRDRLSDWARMADQFRYLEAGDATLIINAAHIVEICDTIE